MNEIPAEVVWRDEGLLVLNKPSGVPVLADRSGVACLWDALQQALAAEGVRPRAVHRIDKGTSGLLLVALDPAVERQLTRAFVAGSVGKWYSALGAGHLPGANSFDIDLPLIAGRKSRWRVAGPREAITLERRAARRTFALAAGTALLDKPGKPSKAALTRVRSVASNPSMSWLCVRPHSGRTHQIRVHLAWIGLPLLGDHLYGAPSDPAQAASRLALHCHRLILPPLDDGRSRPNTFRASLPEDFLGIMRRQA